MENNLKYQQIWSKVLSNGEEVKHEFSISDKFLKLNLVCGIIFSIPLMFLAGFGFFVLTVSLIYNLWYAKVANAYAFTNKRVLIHRGWLNTSLVSVDYHKITDVFVEQGFLDKIIAKSGNIAIDTAGSNQKAIIIKNIDSPYEAKKILDSLK